MPSKNVKRFAQFCTPASYDKLTTLAKQHGVAVSSMLEVLVLGLESAAPELVNAIYEGGKAAVTAARPDGRRKRADVLAKLQRLPKEQLEQLLAEAEKQQGAAA